MCSDRRASGAFQDWYPLRADLRRPLALLSIHRLERRGTALITVLGVIFGQPKIIAANLVGFLHMQA